jgi:hypothetical protein
MKKNRLRPRSDDVDGLRLLGLSRIPRCTYCPRLSAFVNAAESGHPLPVHSLPRAPVECQHQVCRPLIPRYFRVQLRPRSERRVFAVAGMR